MANIKDSGNRREFSTGAVRDICEGKGRCDLLPLDIVAELVESSEIANIERFRCSGDVGILYEVFDSFKEEFTRNNLYELMLEVSHQFEDGAKKYGIDNWKKGIPVHCYIDSAVRHYLKYKSGWDDEPHDRAFVWNILCVCWTMVNKPELDDFTVKEEYKDEC